MGTPLIVTLPYLGLRYTIHLGLVSFQVVRWPINMFLLAQVLLFNERIRIKFVAHLTLLTAGKCQHGQTRSQYYWYKRSAASISHFNISFSALEQGWCSGVSTRRLPPVIDQCGTGSRPAIDAIWGLSLLLVLSLNSSPSCFWYSGFPNTSKFNSICNARTHLNEFLRIPKCYVVHICGADGHTCRRINGDGRTVRPTTDCYGTTKNLPDEEISYLLAHAVLRTALEPKFFLFIMLF